MLWLEYACDLEAMFTVRRHSFDVAALNWVLPLACHRVQS